MKVRLEGRQIVVEQQTLSLQDACLLAIKIHKLVLERQISENNFPRLPLGGFADENPHVQHE